jgi:GNAT superfamily N-acetyltransferase
MLEQELIDEFSDGVRMFGYHHNNKLIGVIGIQELKDVTLIRHAYTLTSFQGKGTGSALLEYLLKKIRIHVYWWALGEMPHGRFDFMKNLVLFFTQKNNQLYYLKNIGKYHQNKSKIQ